MLYQSDSDGTRQPAGQSPRLSLTAYQLYSLPYSSSATAGLHESMSGESLLQSRLHQGQEGQDVTNCHRPRRRRSSRRRSLHCH